MSETSNNIPSIRNANLIDEQGLRTFWGGVKDYIDSKLTKVFTTIEDNELVVSNALTDLNNRKADKSEIEELKARIAELEAIIAQITIKE